MVRTQTKPVYEDTEAEAGTTAEVAAPTFQNAAGETVAAPEGVTFAATEDTPADVTVNEDGSLSVPVSADAQPGDKITVPVRVSHPGGLDEVVQATVTVAGEAVEAPAWADTETPADEPVTIPNTGGPVPDGSTVEVVGGDANGTATLNPDNGEIEFTPSPDAKPGDTVTVQVKDKDGEVIDEITVTIGEPTTPPMTNEEQYQPKYDAIDAPRGEETIAPAPKEENNQDFPEGTKYQPGTGIQDWTTVNPDGTVTLNPAADLETGTYNVPVDVVYPDDTKDTVYVPVTVTEQAPAGEMQNVTHQPTYAPVDATQGEESPIEVPTDSRGDGLPDGTKFAKGADAPEWVTINEDGSGTATPGDDVNPGDYTFPVEVTYPDGSAETVYVPVTVKSAEDAPAGEKQNVTHQPTYAPVDATQGEESPIEVPTDARGDGLPEGTKFAKGADAPEWVTINEDGSGTATPDVSIDPGSYTFPVEVTYPDGSIETVYLSVSVTSSDVPADGDDLTYQPVYEATRVTQDETATVPAPTDGKGGTLPADAEYAAGTGAPEWVTVNQDGSITLTPGADVEPSTNNVPVEVTYSDGSAETVFAAVTVESAEETPTTGDNVTYQPGYDASQVKQGETATVPAPQDPNNALPEGTSFDKGEQTPEWVTVGPNGELTLAPGEDVTAGDYQVPVKVTYPDNTSEYIYASVLVQHAKATEVDGDNVTFQPTYPQTDAPVGETTEVDAPKDEGGKELPEGTEYKPGTDAPEWAEVNPDGTLTLTPGDEVKPGSYNVPVEVTYPDKTTETVYVPVTVPGDDTPVNGENVDNQPVYGPVDAPRGDETKVDAPKNEDGSLLPENTEFKAGTDAPEWVEINPDGTGTVKPGADVETGTYNVPVEVTYPDGTTETVYVPVTVTENADKPPFVPGDGDGDEGDTSGSSGGLLGGLLGGGIIGGIIGGILGNEAGSSTPGSSAPGSSTPGSTAPGHQGGNNGGNGGNQGGDTGGNIGGDAGQTGSQQGGQTGDNAGQGTQPGQGVQPGQGAQGGDSTGAQGGQTGQSGQAVAPGASAGSGQTGAASGSASRGGSLAMTGVSGVAITLGAAVMALAVGGALMALRRRRNN